VESHDLAVLAFVVMTSIPLLLLDIGMRRAQRERQGRRGTKLDR
jgi:hypothetical protein